ncbi:hypothetical protein [Polymorphospora sp. NPDC050346]|uniref:hypothetical protein n=1 Tax=Polymorphospora sp. NPDC050346 TaxID=3155780 RepID=UPI0033C42226
MDKKRVRNAEQLLRQLPFTIPVPFDVGKFVDLVAEHRGRPIHILKLDSTVLQVLNLDTDETETPCGLWLSTAAADYIVVDGTAPPVLRDHSLLHELSHMLCDHTGLLQLDASTLRFDTLDTAVVQRVLGRTSRYPNEEERDAETLASVIGEFAARRSPVPRPGTTDDETAAVLDRFSATLAADRRWL